MNALRKSKLLAVGASQADTPFAVPLGAPLQENDGGVN